MCYILYTRQQTRAYFHKKDFVESKAKKGEKIVYFVVKLYVDFMSFSFLFFFVARVHIAVARKSMHIFVNVLSTYVNRQHVNVMLFLR